MAFSLTTESTATGIRRYSCRPQISHLSSASFQRSSVHRPKTAYPRFSGVVSGYRYYDPASTKWLCNDPLGEQAGPNLSEAFGNDPVNNTDPLGLWYLEGDQAIAVQGDTLGGLAAILGIDWHELPDNGDPKKLQIGQGVNVARWIAPLRAILGRYQFYTEGLLRLSTDKMAFEDAIRENTDARGNYDPAAVSKAAREKRALYERAIAAAGGIEKTARWARLAEGGRRWWLARQLATATDRQKLALQVLEAAKTGKSISITKGGVVLGVIGAGFDAEAAYHAFRQGQYKEGVRKTSTAGVAVGGIWFPPAAVAGALYAVAFDPLLSYTIGGGAIEHQTHQNIVENDMLYYQQINRIIEHGSQRIEEIEPDVQRAVRVFEQLTK